MSDDLRFEIDEALRGVFAGVSANLSLDANGMVSIGFKDDVIVTLEVPRTGRHVYLHAPLLHRMPGSEAEVAEAALSLNLFQTALPGTWIAMDTHLEVVMLCGCLDRRLCASRDLADFLEGFVASVSTTRDYLARRDGALAASAVPVPGEGSIIFRS